MKTTLPPLTKASSARGAQMGRPDIMPVNPKAAIKMRLYRLPFIDVAYDQGGAYWGSPANTYRAVTQNKQLWLSNWDGSPQEPRHIETFVRASSRKAAKDLVKIKLPGATFYR